MYVSTTSTGDGGPAPPTHTVVTSGHYGAVNWTVCKELWDILPADKRVRALDASTGQIDPFFVKLVENLLVRLSIDAKITTLACDWSLETIEADCSFGMVVWQVSQGTWDAMPADRRENLIELMIAAIHRFFHDHVQVPLMRYATRDLP